MPGRNTEAKPSALKHGFSSRWFLEAIKDEVDELAGLLAGSSAGEPGVDEAARRAAEATLRLRQVRSMKTHALNQAEPGREGVNASDALRTYGATLKDLSSGRRAKPGNADTAADLAMLKYLEEAGTMLQGLDKYERQALSRRAKAIRELDFARIEAARRKPN